MEPGLPCVSGRNPVPKRGPDAWQFEWLAEYNIHSDSTKNRRFSTIRTWIQYFKNIFEIERT